MVFDKDIREKFFSLLMLMIFWKLKKNEFEK